MSEPAGKDPLVSRHREAMSVFQSQDFNYPPPLIPERNDWIFLYY